MNKNLLIVGAGTYGVVAKEIAESMGCFETIEFVDDEMKETPNGIKVIGTTLDIENLAVDFSNIFVSIENPDKRLMMISKIGEETPCRLVTLVSPLAYIASSAQVMQGSLVEPMAVVQTGSVITIGCIISSGAVVGHASMCCDGVHVDANATVADRSLVPSGTKILCGEVFKRDTVESTDLFFDIKRWEKALTEIRNKKPHGPLPIDGLEYCFEDGM